MLPMHGTCRRLLTCVPACFRARLLRAARQAETPGMAVQEIVMQCLHRRPKQRPTFQALQAQLLDYYLQICKDDQLARRHPKSGRNSTSSRHGHQT